MFGAKSLETILSNFTKVVDDLRELQVENAKVAAQNTTKIVELEAENKALAEESEKALNVQKKVEALIS